MTNDRRIRCTSSSGQTFDGVEEPAFLIRHDGKLYLTVAVQGFPLDCEDPCVRQKGDSDEHVTSKKKAIQALNRTWENSTQKVQARLYTHATYRESYQQAAGEKGASPKPSTAEPRPA